MTTPREDPRGAAEDLAGRTQDTSALSRPSGTAPVVISVVPVSDPATLHALAALIEARTAQRAPVAGLSEEKLGELGDMVMAGDIPTIGWWRRALGISR